jgi:alkane 1-monooxygenase
MAVVTLLPTVLLVCASLWGGLWTLAPILLISTIGHTLDALFETPNSDADHLRFEYIFPITLGFMNFAMLGLAVWALSSQPFALPTKITLLMGYTLYFSHVSNAAGHELIHRSDRLSFTLGKWIFISLLFGHHTSAHRLIHHRYVATRFDPNTARYGETFYRFFARAWRGSFRAGLSAENIRLGQAAESRQISTANPYFFYITGSFALLGISTVCAGPMGLIFHITLAFLSQVGLLLTNYTQHYGLTRSQSKDGTFAPVAPQHSWNAPHWFARNLTLNAPLHSDHHAKPSRCFAQLQNHAPHAAPRLPYSPEIMSTLALFPRRWRKVMHPRVAKWYDNQETHDTNRP